MCGSGGRPGAARRHRRQVGPPVSCETGRLPRTVRFAVKDRNEGLCPFSPSGCRALRSGCHPPALTQLWVGGCLPPWETLVSGQRRTVRRQLPWTEAPRLHRSKSPGGPASLPLGALLWPPLLASSWHEGKRVSPEPGPRAWVGSAPRWRQHVQGQPGQASSRADLPEERQ